jgi:hypothetical protein
LCVSRCLEAEKQAIAPQEVPEGTLQKALEYTSLELLSDTKLFSNCIQLELFSLRVYYSISEKTITNSFFYP